MLELLYLQSKMCVCACMCVCVCVCVCAREMNVYVYDASNNVYMHCQKHVTHNDRLTGHCKRHYSYGVLTILYAN